MQSPGCYPGLLRYLCDQYLVTTGTSQSNLEFEVQAELGSVESLDAVL